MSRRENYRNQEFLNKVSEKIVQIAKSKGLRQEDISGALGLSDNRQVGRIFRAETNYSVSELERISKVLGVHPKEFFDFDI